jgi:hypothetical protein
MARRLARNVIVDGQWYGPAYGNAHQVPAEAADRIADVLWEDDGVAAKVAPPEATGSTESTSEESGEAPQKAASRRAPKGR